MVRMGRFAWYTEGESFVWGGGDIGNLVFYHQVLGIILVTMMERRKISGNPRSYYI